MKLAMEAFAQNQESYAVHMKIVAASRTFAERDKNRGNNQQQYPDSEERSHRPVCR